MSKNETINPIDNEIYSDQNIQVLEGVDAIRKMPSMYIGSVDAIGKFHIFTEIFDNSIDEYMSGHCNVISIVYRSVDEFFSIYDNGRGIPTNLNEKYGISTLELVATTIHAGGKFDRKSYRYSGGKHGVGMAAANALSARFTITVFRDNKRYYQSFANGKKETEVLVTENNPERKRGTLVEFIPDNSIFTEKIDPIILSQKLEKTSILNKNLRIELQIDENAYVFERKDEGINKLIELHSGYSKPVTQIYSFNSSLNILDCKYEFAFCYVSGFDPMYHESFVNNIHTLDGGVHVNAFVNSLTDFLRYKTNNKLEFDKSDLQTNLVLVMNLLVSTPDFANQTKTKLNNKELLVPLSEDIFRLLIDGISDVSEILSAIQINKAAKKRAEETRLINKELEKSFKFKALTDCISSDKSVIEVYFVEGKSAAGTGKDGRYSERQAIAVVRGKVINVLKYPLAKVLKNEAVRSILSIIGILYSKEEKRFICDIPNYSKTILATDADSDGQHIKMLFLTLIFEFCPSLISNGYVYVANSPLFRVEVGKGSKRKRYFFFDYISVLAFLKEHNLTEADVIISRFKGLGEFVAIELREFIFDYNTRNLTRVTLKDAEIAAKTIKNYMSIDSDFRRGILENVDSGETEVGA